MGDPHCGQDCNSMVRCIAVEIKFCLHSDAPYHSVAVLSEGCGTTSIAACVRCFISATPKTAQTHLCSCDSGQLAAFCDCILQGRQGSSSQPAPWQSIPPLQIWTVQGWCYMQRTAIWASARLDTSEKMCEMVRGIIPRSA